MATKSIVIEPLKETALHIKLVGDSDLILHKKSRYYEQSEIWKQSHDKGADFPAIYKQGKNIWEQFITTLHWEKPIAFHDEDILLYSEEEWNDYMANNRPCILATAFSKSFVEAFITFFKESIKKNGTDVKRAFNMIGQIYPINFSSVEPVNAIVQTNGAGGGSPVLCSYNLFHGWNCEIEVSCPNVVFPSSTVLSIIQSTGRYIGIGSQRLNGYGKYHIEEVKEI